MIKFIKLAIAFFIFVFLSCQRKGNIVYAFDSKINGMDAVLSIPNSNNNYGSETELNIYCDSINGKRYLNRAALYFNLDKFPKGTKIDSAFLQLYFNDKSGLYKVKKPEHSGNTRLIVENIEEAWKENEISWNRYPKIGTEKLYFEPHKTSNQDFRLNITELVVLDDKTLKHGYGFLIRLEKEELGNYVHLCSRENIKINSSPKLKIYAKR
ncbi:DNRLRE domain-containing protein [Confluentibacter sediminis]|uniref:DNRLRE domain-containing protein n=1 Tax=Confluentibacter sediminis TaxID=2219045 RepID=UPI000DAE253E|nr:DNRLRE domain-containing protein [Confluentibacter sediminis]